jgi:hypothetical protein
MGMATSGWCFSRSSKAQFDRVMAASPSLPATTSAERGPPSIKDSSPK